MVKRTGPTNPLLKKLIEDLIASQTFFKRPKIRQQLLASTPVKIRELNSNCQTGSWSNKINPEDKVKINKFLRNLEYLKEQTQELAQLEKKIEPQGIKITADILLDIMFKIVYAGMFQEKWGSPDELR